MNPRFRKLFVPLIPTEKREQHSLMTEPTVPLGVTDSLTFVSNPIRYKINRFQRIIWENHDCLATGILVQAFDQREVEVLFPPKNTKCTWFTSFIKDIMS